MPKTLGILVLSCLLSCTRATSNRNATQKSDTIKSGIVTEFRDESALKKTKKWIDESINADTRRMNGSSTYPVGDWVQRGRMIRDVDIHLLSLLRAEKNEYARKCIVAAFDYVGSKRDVVPLIEVLNKDEPGVRASAAAALGYIGDPEAVMSLCDATHAANENVRGNALIALGRIGGHQAEACIRARSNDVSLFVRQCAAKALEIMRQPDNKRDNGDRRIDL